MTDDRFTFANIDPTRRNYTGDLEARQVPATDRVSGR